MTIRKFIPLVVYMLVLFLVFSWTGNLFGNASSLSYSQVVELFRQEQVKSFVVSDNTIQLELHNPYNGETRVKEFTQMVKCLHDNGISVVMDVVYNHVFEAKDFCFNKIVPDYFSRTDENGKYVKHASDSAVIKNHIESYEFSETTKENFKKVLQHLDD